MRFCFCIGSYVGGLWGERCPMCNSGNDALLPTSSHLSSPRTGLCVIFCVCVMHDRQCNDVEEVQQ